MTTISALIPTAANDLPRLALLRRSIESALSQTQAGDEVIIAGDVTDSSLDAVRELCGRFGQEAPPGVAVRFIPHTSGQHDFGHSQLTYAMHRAAGDYLTGCDDDDVWTPGAFDAMREAIAELPQAGPLLFRFRTHYGYVVWDTPGVVAEGHISGHCLVLPALPSFIGVWSPRYEGDFDFIRSTLDLWAAVDVAPVFVDRLISIARPAVRYA